MQSTGRTEEHLAKVAAIEPVYHREFGDVSRICLNDGEEFLDLRSIRGVKQAITRVKALNHGYLRRLCGEEIGRVLSLPLPLAASLVLVPLRVRQPVTNNDAAYGLFNLLNIRKVSSEVGGGALIVLTSGHSFKVLTSKETALSHLAEGTLLRQHFLQNVWDLSRTLPGWE